MVCNDLIIFVAVQIICKYAKTCILLKNFWTLNVMTAQNLLENWEMCRKFSSPYNLSYPRPNFIPIHRLWLILLALAIVTPSFEVFSIRSFVQSLLSSLAHHLTFVVCLWSVVICFLYIVSCIWRSCDHHESSTSSTLGKLAISTEWSTVNFAFNAAKEKLTACMTEIFYFYPVTYHTQLGSSASLYLWLNQSFVDSARAKSLYTCLKPKAQG